CCCVLLPATPRALFFVCRETVGRDGASGFQSAQYRVFEFRLGLKYRALTMQTAGGPISFSLLDAAASQRDRTSLEAALAAPSIYDATVDFMARTMFGGISP